MSYFDADAQEMLEIYLLETRQLAEQLSEVLLEAEHKRTLEKADIHNIFRIMHTIKSSSAMMGLSELSALAHQMEDLFSFYREQEGEGWQAEPKLFDLLFSALDYIEDELERMTEETYLPKSAAEIKGLAAVYLDNISENSESPGKADPLECIQNQWIQKGGILVRITFENGCRMENIRAFMLVRQISGMCSQVETYPENLENAQESARFISENGMLLRFESDEAEQVLEVVKTGLFVQKFEVLSGECQEIRHQEVKERGSFQENKETEFLNVKAERLDRLQNLAGEMMVLMLGLENELEKHGLSDVKEGIVYQMNRMIGEAERMIMQIRLVPVRKIVPKLQRILRDICRDQNKEAELIINCPDLEADKSVVDYVSEALMHVIRNAVDHGIESAEERLKVGKSRKGTITFSVEGTVGEMLLSVSDDGRGLDEESIKERARKRGMLTKPEEEYTSREIWELILLPGFTTNEAVTEYSGRGVGLDVVKSILEEAGGHIYIFSEPGLGSKFTIAVPLTLATMECIRFRVGEYRFSMPARHVFQFLEYSENRKNIQMINERNYILYQDRVIPMIDLHRFYDIPGENRDGAILVYVKGKEREACVLVDAMYEQKRIVIKPLPALLGIDFRRNTGISGCSIMGNGKVCTALDTEILIDQYEREGRHGTWR